MHKKDFSNWIKLKESIDKEIKRPNVLTREIRWCSLGHNVGSEIDGKGDLFARPAVILKIISNHTCLVLPLTHSEKIGRHILEFEFMGEKNKARLDQVRIIDLKRLKGKIGRISENKFKDIKNSAQDFLFS